jgi:sulfoxide reductase heme-binding subunit YedZ
LSEVVERQLERAVYFFCAAMALWLIGQHVVATSSGARQAINVQLGLWATRLLIVGLALTPLSQILREPRIRRLRRPVGLAAAAFTALHLIQFVAFSGIWPDQFNVLWERTYLAIGVASAALIAPLAATSFNSCIRWMGPKRWFALHTLVYPAVVLAAVHEALCWTTSFERRLHFVLIALLLVWRIIRRVAAPPSRPRTAAAPKTRTPAIALTAGQEDAEDAAPAYVRSPTS